MTKRILSVLLSITLILSSFVTVGFAEVETKIGFGAETVEGDVVRVPVTLTSLPESLDKLSSLTVNYDYDSSKISYSGVEQGLLAVSSDNAVDGRVSWYQANSSITSVDNDVLFTLVFSKKADAEHIADVVFTYGQITSDTATYEAADGLVLGSAQVDLGDLPDAEFSLEYSVNEEEKQLEVPVYIDSVPDGLVDISALTLSYEYDTDKLTYAGVKSGAIDLGEDGVFDSAGKIAWYSTQGVVPSAEEALFKLVFDIKANAEGQARIALIFAEAADSNYKFTQLLTLNKIMANIPDFDEAPRATVFFGDAVIEDRDIRIPVVLDTLPEDITGLASVDVRYTFDANSLEYVGIENGVISVDDGQQVAGQVSWYSAAEYTEAIEDTILFYILLKANYDVSGETTVAITSVELGDIDSTSALVDKTDVKFNLPEVAAPVLPAKIGFADATFEEEYVKVPVYLDKLPVGLEDITSFTFNYDYDKTKLEYAETLSGVITTGVDYATAGSVSWYSNQPITNVEDYLFTLVFKVKAGATGLAEIVGTFAEASDSSYNLTTDITLSNVFADVTDFAPDEEAEIVIQPEVAGKEVKVPVVLNVLPTDLSDLASITVEYSYDEESLKLVGIEGGLVDAVINEDGTIEWTAQEGQAIENVEDDVLFILIFEVQYDSSSSTEIVITDVVLSDSENTVSGSVSVDTEGSGPVQIPSIPAPAIRELSSNLSDVVVPYEIATAENSEELIREYVKTLGIRVIVIYITGEERDVTSQAAFSVDPVTFKLIITYKNANCEVGMDKEPKTEVAKETVQIITREDGKKVSRIPLKLNKIPMILGKVSKIVINAQVLETSQGKATLNIVSDHFAVSYEGGKYILTPNVSTFSLRRAATGGLTEGEDIEFANIELEPTCAQRDEAQVDVGAIELYNDGDAQKVTLDALGQFNAEIPFVDHTWGEWTETVPPTVTTDGEKQRTCSACGEVQTEVVPKLVGVESIAVTPETLTVPYDVWNETDKLSAIKNHLAFLGTLEITVTMTDSTPYNVTETAFDSAVLDTEALTLTFSYTDSYSTTVTDTIALSPVLVQSFAPVEDIVVPYGVTDVEGYVLSALSEVKAILTDDAEIVLDPSEYTIAYADGVATITLNIDPTIKLEIPVTQVTVVSIVSSITSLSIAHENWYNKTSAEIADYIKSVAEYSITATMSDASTLDVSSTAIVTVDSANNKATVTAGTATAEIALTFLPYGYVEDNNTPESGGGSSRPPKRPITNGGAGIVITPAQPETGIFVDLAKTHYAYDAIVNLYERGIISGDGNKIYPENGITRQEIAKVALGIADIKVDETLSIDAPDKADVADWAKGYVATAVKEGIIKGYEDGTIQPKRTITRGEMVAIIVRMLGIQVEGAKAAFKDVNESLWSAPYISTAAELGIVNGYEDGTFKPNKGITRAEAFTIYNRVLTFVDAIKAAGK